MAAPARAGERFARAFEFTLGNADGDEGWSELPRVFDLLGLHPACERFFGVALFEGVHAEGLLFRERVFLKLEHAVLLLLGQFGLAELRSELVHPHEILAKLSCGPDGSGSGVVQLVHEPSGEGAE